jgi:poly-gamma-glutamate synthesis protein (capsule biosynthesis protein)
VFAHRLIEEGVAIVHGHSSHHVRAIEVFKGRLILYGCGDFLTDYEGISGNETFRGDLALMYLVELNSDNGELIAARLVPLQMRRFRLERASAADAKWLCNLLNELERIQHARGHQSDNSETRMVGLAILCALRLADVTKTGAHRVTRPTYAGRRAVSARRKRSTSAGFLSE